jgi:hypothetical protein
VTRVDLGDVLAGLRQCALGFANFGLDRGEVLLDRRHGRRQQLVKAPQGVRIRGLLLRQTRREHVLRFSSQPLESLSKRLQVPIGGVQFPDLALIQLLLAGQLDEVLGGLAIGRRKGAEPRPDVSEFFNLLGQVVDRSPGRPDAIRIGLERACALGQRQVNVSHLLAAKLVQQIPAFVAEDFVGDGLDLQAAVGVQRQKGASIEIDRIDRPAVGCEKHRVLLESPFDRVAVRPVGESSDGHQGPAGEICLNQVGAMLRRGRDPAKGEPHRLGKRGFSTSPSPDDASQAQGNVDAQTGQKPAADFDLLNDPHTFSICQP